MADTTKLKLLGASVVLCLFIIAGLTYKTGLLRDRVNELENGNMSVNNSASPLFSPPAKGSDPWDSFWDDFNSMPRDFSQMEAWMNQRMNSMNLGHSFFDKPSLGMLNQGPSIEFEEGRDEYKLTIEMLEGEEVELKTSVSDGVLFVSGTVKRSHSNDEKSALYQSHFSSSFSRSFVLDKPVDQDAMQMNNEDGKTIVILPKRVS